MVRKKEDKRTVNLRDLAKKRDLLEADLFEAEVEEVLKLEAELHTKTKKFTGKAPTKPV